MTSDHERSTRDRKTETLEGRSLREFFENEKETISPTATLSI